MITSNRKWVSQEFFGGSQMTVAVLGELSSLRHLPGASTPTVRFHCFKIALILLFCYICYFCCFRKGFLDFGGSQMTVAVFYITIFTPAAGVIVIPIGGFKYG